MPVLAARVGFCQRALVAQGIEHHSPKVGVGRSNRLGGTTRGEAAEKSHKIGAARRCQRAVGP